MHPTHYVKYRTKDTQKMTSATARSEREAKVLARRLQEALYADVKIVTYADFWHRSSV